MLDRGQAHRHMSIRVIGAVILALLLDERGLGNTLTLVYGPIRPWVSGIAPDPRRPGPSGLPMASETAMAKMVRSLTLTFVKVSKG
jgi:hypothetical protein